MLEKSSWRCSKCGRAGRMEVDHVVPVAKGGDPWAMGNLQCLCRGCHIKKTRQEFKRTPTDAERRWQQLVVEIAAH